ncbi:MAG: lysylphosphatidylglycerol synthase transmembrane domain-containing protein [archaeon]
MKIKKWHLGIVGLLLLALILSSINLWAVAEILAGINPGYFFAALALELAGIFLKGLKYRFVVKAHNRDISAFECTKFFLIGFFLSLVTPGRVGELARAFYANKRIHSIGKSISTVVFDRAIDLAILVAMGLSAAVYFSFSMRIAVLPVEAVAGIALAFVLAVSIFSRKRFAKFFLKPVFNVVVPKSLKHAARTGFNDFYASLGEAGKNRKAIALAACIGIAVWAAGAVTLYFYLLSLNIFVVPFYFVFLLLPAIAFVEMLPISFSGLGTREAACIILLGIFFVSPPEAVAFSVLVFAVGYLLNAAIGFVFFSSEPIKGLEGLQ